MTNEFAKTKHDLTPADQIKKQNEMRGTFEAERKGTTKTAAAPNGQKQQTTKAQSRPAAAMALKPRWAGKQTTTSFAKQQSSLVKATAEKKARITDLQKKIAAEKKRETGVPHKSILTTHAKREFSR